MSLETVALTRLFFTLLLDVAFFVAFFWAFDTGALITFVALGVGTVVHCQIPEAFTHAWPSFAVWYASEVSKIVSCGSRSRTCPFVLLRLKWVSPEKNALKLPAGSISPSGNVYTFVFVVPVISLKPDRSKAV